MIREIRKFPVQRSMLLVLLTISIGRADTIELQDGFVLTPWLTNAGDLRGVTVGSGQGFSSVPYVYSFSERSIIRVDAKEEGSLFATGFANGTARMVIDPGNDFNGDMFVSGITDGGFGIADRIYRVTPSGTRSVFFEDSQFTEFTKGLAFGTGTAFGSNLFIVDAGSGSLQSFDSAANRSSFGSGVTSNVWEDDLIISKGGVFGEHAFITDSLRSLILRMSPEGVTSQFAEVEGALAIAIGTDAFGDYLYVGTYQGNVFKVDHEGAVSAFASGFGRQTPEGGIRGIYIDNGAMWLTSDRGILYKITPVPEPSSFLLMLAGSGMFILVRSRRRNRVRQITHFRLENY